MYTGLIRVRKQAHGTNAFQTNRNLKLSDDAWAESVPNLMIENNDVHCSHASAVGPIAGVCASTLRPGWSAAEAAPVGARSVVSGRSGSSVTTLLMTPFGLLINTLFIFFTGVYLAYSPQMYRDGFVALFPVSVEPVTVIRPCSLPMAPRAQKVRLVSISARRSISARVKSWSSRLLSTRVGRGARSARISG